MRLLVAPWFFRLPGLRSYHGYAFRRTIVIRDASASDDLLTHELCHIWQSQRRRGHSIWAWFTSTYDENPYEQEARAATARTGPPSKE